MIGSFNDICRELYEAREQLDSRGLNRGNQKVPNGTFSQYLQDVGLQRELYEAREQLAMRGGDRRSIDFNVQNGTMKGWREYLQDVGLQRAVRS